jgi:hydroxymethylpyrimidine/phosphomethylpyrimidine kinase
LIVRADIVTPNLPEAEILCGTTIASVAEMRISGQALLDLGCRAVLMKGGHLPGSTVTDILVCAAGIRSWESPRIETRHTHGTGCTLASAIAAGLAQGQDLESAVDRARTYVQRAIVEAPGLGRGHGPLDHAHPLRPQSDPPAS